MLWDLSGTVRDRGHRQLCYDRMESLECWDLLGQKYAEGLPLQASRVKYLQIGSQSHLLVHRTVHLRCLVSRSVITSRETLAYDRAS